VLKRLSKIALVLSLVCVVGGHWALLQSLAWVGMTINFSRTDRLDVAIGKTFNGQHPCNLCHFVAEGKKSERTKEIVKAETKLDLISWLCFSLPTPTQHSIELTAFLVSGCLRLDAPPSPPPRFA
jgi:hypothetical protein